MDRQTWFLLALALLVVASLAVSAAGWTLFARERRAGRPHAGSDAAASDAELAAEAAAAAADPDAGRAAPAPIPVPPGDEASDA
jgi:hypothetical protein